MKTLPRLCVAVVVLIACLAFEKLRGWAAPSGNVDVILWFDTEDYLLPADDDACKRLAEMLTERGVRATFKVVGEKARVLEKRGRTDVIEALQKHDIGYHANFHSVHPTPSEYLADCGLLDGMAEFVRREGGGAKDVERVLGVPTLACYGQPGSSWGGQAIAALKQIGVAPHGVPCYVDEGDHVGLNEQPFWYDGALVVYHMGQNWTRMELHDPAALQPAKGKVSAIADRLKAQGGGLISIYYHPCEWVHQQFWDGVNFRRGANPPREQWKAPPQRPASETEGAFNRFAQYIDYIRTIPHIRFVTASDLPVIYPDATRSIGATEQDLNDLARILNVADSVDWRVVRNQAYSVADQFYLLATAVNSRLQEKGVEYPLRAADLLGPDGSAPRQSAVQEVSWPAMKAAVGDVVDFMKTEQRIPARVFIGPDPVTPADFLVGLAAAYFKVRQQETAPVEGNVALGKGVELRPARHIAKDTADLFGGWVIHKEGFRAPKILEVAREQAWTLKPAIREQ
jgi:hypothetical protein